MKIQRIRAKRPMFYLKILFCVSSLLVFTSVCRSADINSLLDRAHSGEREAQVVLGWEYLWGLNVRPSLAKAKFWAEQLEIGSVERLSLLGHVHTQWINIDSSREQGYLLLEEAAKKGDRRAIFRLATIDMQDDVINSGNGPTKALARIESLALERDLLACFFYGYLYMNLDDKLVQSGAWDATFEICVLSLYEAKGESAFFSYLFSIVNDKIGDEERMKESLLDAANSTENTPPKFFAITSLSSDDRHYAAHRIQAVEYFLRGLEAFEYFPYFIDYIEPILSILPDELKNIWKMKYTNFYFSNYLIDDRTSLEKLSARRNKSDKYSLVGLIDETRKVIKTWRARGVIFHPYDLSKMAWSHHVGKHGPINDGLAQILAEESLRTSILINDVEFERIARTTLADILKNSLNPHIRNPSLAKKHLMALAESDINMVSSLLLNHYFGKVTLTEEEFRLYQRHFENTKGEKHFISNFPKIERFRKLTISEQRKILEKAYIKSPTLLTSRVFGLFYESQGLGRDLKE
ncbi:MAG: hypothetical protein P8N92_01615, partial [Burkholderiales bacterium]|nr:hypothetical protein [Burkholderiales bacterium]